MGQIELPEVTRKRMAGLLSLLKTWPEDKITSAAISGSTGWKDSLIRHDLWLLGFNKGVSNGYRKDELQKAISQALGIETKEESDKSSNDGRNCCIVGLGRLGAALLDDEFTDGSSFKIKAGFDSNLYRVEVLRSTFPLYPASEMNRVIKELGIEYAILTVKNESAAAMAQKLVDAGIKGIVNMTNIVLNVPKNVKVQHLSILNALNLVI